MNNNPLAIAGSQFTAIIGRAIGFTTTPADVQIVSINGTAVGGSMGTGSTVAPDGLVTVNIVAKKLPTAAAGEETPQGVLIGIPAATTTNQAIAKFTIVQ